MFGETPASQSTTSTRFSEAIPLSLQQAISDPRIRSYQASDYAPLAIWMQDLARFYDGHDDKNRLLDQLVGAETGDKSGFFTKNKFMFICEVAGDPAGMLCLNYKRGGSAKIGPVIVNSAVRGQGVGSALMGTAEEVASAGEVRKLYATTSDQNAHVNHLFEKAGYKVEAELPDQYKSGSIELIWGKHLILPTKAKEVVVQSALHEAEKVSGLEVVRLAGESSPIIDQANSIYQQWHDDLGSDFINGMLAGARRGLSFQSKGKVIMVARGGKIDQGMATYTPKRGGPVKLYPMFGTAEAQTVIIDHAAKLAAEQGNHKLYTFAHSRDFRQMAVLEAAGFASRGLIESPYKSGHDLVPFDRVVN